MKSEQVAGRNEAFNRYVQLRLSEIAPTGRRRTSTAENGDGAAFGELKSYECYFSSLCDFTEIREIKVRFLLCCRLNITTPV